MERLGISWPATVAVLTCALMMMVMIPEVSSTRFIVGANMGWSSNANYNKWVQDRHFYLGDWLSAAQEVPAPEGQPCLPTDSGSIIPTTPLLTFLERIQETALDTFGLNGFDPKLYVDVSLKFNLSHTHEAFNKLPRTENGSVLASDLNGFFKEYLNGVDEDLVYVEPVVAELEGFLPKVENPEVRAWALEVHSLWKNLGRKESDQVLEHLELHTPLPLPNPVIIPGLRFREVYYWDSYWVIRGLLASKMYDTAKGIVTNLISLVEEFGYVLNGARAYYSNRSQPPLLSAMIVDIFIRTGDLDFVRKSLPALLTEHNFWNSGIHKTNIQDAQGATHSLSRYYAMWNEPRPESSTIDKETAIKLSNFCEKQQLYRELASAAESGWDFSTRWMRNAIDLMTLAATSVLPVDLNAFILGVISSTANTLLLILLLPSSILRRKMSSQMLTPFFFFFLASELCHLSRADVGTATQYSLPNTSTICYGSDPMQFPSNNLFAAAGDWIWNDGASCGRRYLVRCISATTPGTCVVDKKIQIRIVDYAPNANGTMVLSQTAFGIIANLTADFINIEFQEV